MTEPRGRGPWWWLEWCFAICVAMLLLARVWQVGGADLFYYLCYARDLALGRADVPHARYIYFPGGTDFWWAVWPVVRGNFAAVQLIHVLLLLVNATLVFLVAKAASGRAGPAALAMAVYAWLALRFEGLVGTTEPIATIPWTLGLLGWSALWARGDRRAGPLAFGAACGLALFVKQQAGPLLAGALVFAVQELATSRSPLAAARAVGAAILACFGVFAAGMAIEGGGWSGVRTALDFATGYRAETSLGTSLAVHGQTAGPFTWIFVLASAHAALLTIRAVRDGKRLTKGEALLVTCAISAAAGLMPVAFRAYKHYLLVPLPAISMSVALFAGEVLDWLARHYEAPSARLPLAPTGLMALSAWTLATTVPRDAREPNRTYFGEAVRRYAPACGSLSPGHDALLIPARENALHWICGTRSVSRPAGYGFTIENSGPPAFDEALDRGCVSQIVWFQPEAGPFEAEVLSKGDWTALRTNVEERGFREADRFRWGSIWKRTNREDCSTLPGETGSQADATRERSASPDADHPS